MVGIDRLVSLSARPSLPLLYLFNVCVYCVPAVSLEAQEDTGSPGAGVTGSLSPVGAEN